MNIIKVSVPTFYKFNPWQYGSPIFLKLHCCFIVDFFFLLCWNPLCNIWNIFLLHKISQKWINIVIFQQKCQIVKLSNPQSNYNHVSKHTYSLGCNLFHYRIGTMVHVRLITYWIQHLIGIFCNIPRQVHIKGVTRCIHSHLFTSRIWFNIIHQYNYIGRRFGLWINSIFLACLMATTWACPYQS
jgi:hypothetical protein